MDAPSSSADNPPPLPAAAPAAEKSKGRWSMIYVALSSAAIAVLLTVIIFQHGSESRLAAERQATAELQKQAELQRETIAARQAALERQAVMERQTMIANQVSAFKASIISIEAEKSAFESRVKEYMMDHKMAICALAAGVAGGNAAMDSSNNFSESAKTIGSVTAVVAGLWALGHIEEVTDVANTMAKCSVMEDDFKKRLTAARSQLQALTTPQAP